jgi:hypothetical protein
LRIGREAHGRTAAYRAGAKPAVDKRIEHQVQKLVRQLERGHLAPGCDLTVKVHQRIGEGTPGLPEYLQEIRRQCAATVEIIVERGRDAALVAGKTVQRQRGGDIQKHIGA